MTWCRIRPEASRYGICKVVPPPSWSLKCEVDLDSPFQFPTNLQKIHTLQEGPGYDNGANYTVRTYKEMADAFKEKWMNMKGYSATDATPPAELSGEDLRRWEHEQRYQTPLNLQLMKDYWSIVETQSHEVSVEYGNDLDTVTYKSGFPSHYVKSDGEECKGIEELLQQKDVPMYSEEWYKRTGWNLNNLPFVEGSLLRHIHTPLNGVNIPWLYLGMLFSTFCWHNEDNYLYSVNYNHFGDLKIWYGVPGDDAGKFEKVLGVSEHTAARMIGCGCVGGEDLFARVLPRLTRPIAQSQHTDFSLDTLWQWSAGLQDLPRPRHLRLHLPEVLSRRVQSRGTQ